MRPSFFLCFSLAEDYGRIARCGDDCFGLFCCRPETGFFGFMRAADRVSAANPLQSGWSGRGHQPSAFVSANGGSLLIEADRHRQPPS